MSRPFYGNPMRRAYLLAVLVCCFPTPALLAGTDAPQVQTLFEKHCIDCHGQENSESGIAINPSQLGKGENDSRKLLPRLLRVLNRQEMPPDDAQQPTAKERLKMIQWLRSQLGASSKRALGNRRLTVDQYNYTMQDLFGVDANFSDLLPADPVSVAGYRNNTQLLGLTSLQMEAYLDSARRAVNRYVTAGDSSPSSVQYHIELEDLFYSTADRYATRKKAPAPMLPERFERVRAQARETPSVYTDPLSPRLPGAFSEQESLRAAIPKMNQQYVAIPNRLPHGELIVRINAAGSVDRHGRFPMMRVEAGVALGDGCSLNKRVLGEVEVTAPLENPQTYEFRIRLEDVPTKGPLKDGETFDALSVFDMDQIFISNIACDSQAVFALGRGGYKTPEIGSKNIADDLSEMKVAGVNLLHLDWLQIEMIQGIAKDAHPYRWQVPRFEEDSSDKTDVDRVGQFLGRFMQTAYRRPVTPNEVEHKIRLFEQLRERGDDDLTSFRETLVGVLVSPSFLFLAPPIPLGISASNGTATAGAAELKSNSFQLASKLSYFLWSSPPDEQLLKLASDGSLNRQSVFRNEAIRMLDDPRRHRLLESFCRQWLRLDKHANIAVNRDVYSTYDEDLGNLSIKETIAYFREVFDSNANALDLLDSNYAMLNSRLAEHYRLPRVPGGALQRVQLPSRTARGGLMTQASILTLNSDGTDSHPIRRGVWLLDRLLDQPPPPPPPNVPELDESAPNLQGLSLKQRIEKHRDQSGCRSCHSQIDPWGTPFESFDAIGRWRTKADTESVLPNGRAISDIRDLKRYLRKHHADQFAEAMVRHLLTYALGRQIEFEDQDSVEQIQRHFAESRYQIRELLLSIVQSDLFR